MAAGFNWAGSGEERAGLLSSPGSPCKIQLGMRWCKVSEDGAGSRGSSRDVCLVFKLRYRTVGEKNGLEEFRH